MFSYLIGNLDWPSAAALIALFVGIGTIFVALIGKHQSKDNIEMEKMKLQNAHEEQLYMRETWRAAEMKKIEQGQITNTYRPDGGNA